MTLLLRYWPYLAAVVVLLGAGGWLGWKGAEPRYLALKSEYTNYQLAVQKQATAAQEAARKALDDQIAARNVAEANNAKIISDLQATADHAAADRDFAVRLLNAARAASSAPAGSPVPQAQGGQPATPAAAPSGSGSLTDDLAASAGECRDAINTLTALQNEIRPQL